jgi:hypothetical protein
MLGSDCVALNSKYIVPNDGIFSHIRVPRDLIKEVNRVNMVRDLTSVADERRHGTFRVVLPRLGSTRLRFDLLPKPSPKSGLDLGLRLEPTTRNIFIP